MYRLKSIKLYFFSIINLFFLSFRKFYLKSNYYNKKLVSISPDRIFYNPSAYLCASLTTGSSDFYKISNTEPEILWKLNPNDRQSFENLHSFLWLTRLDRKNSRIIIQNIIKNWINIFYNYNVLYK